MHDEDEDDRGRADDGTGDEHHDPAPEAEPPPREPCHNRAGDEHDEEGSRTAAGSGDELASGGVIPVRIAVERPVVVGGKPRQRVALGCESGERDRDPHADAGCQEPPPPRARRGHHPQKPGPGVTAVTWRFANNAPGTGSRSNATL